jgi:hypothetical protein
MASSIDYSTETAVSTLFSASDFTNDLHRYLGLDPALDASYQPIDVEDLLHSAIHIVEKDQWRLILNKEVTLKIPYQAFCARDNKIYLPYGTVSTVTSFNYIDSAGDTQPLVEGTDYTLYGTEPAFLWAENWFDVVDLNSDEPEVATIVYTTGYSTFNSIPRGTIHALKTLCYYMFNNRGLDSVDIPMAYKHQCSQDMLNNRRALEYI